MVCVTPPAKAIIDNYKTDGFFHKSKETLEKLLNLL